MNHEDIARISHNVNRAYLITLGDLSQPDWEHAPQWQKDSAIACVRFRLRNRHARPADIHEFWRVGKLRDRWTYGPVENIDKKEHPCMAPFHQLSHEQQARYRLFHEVVSSLEPFLSAANENDRLASERIRLKGLVCAEIDHCSAEALADLDDLIRSARGVNPLAQTHVR